MTTQFKIPASLLMAMIDRSRDKLLNAKTIIIEDDGLHYIIKTEPYTGETTIAAYSTKPRPVQQGTTGTG